MRAIGILVGLWGAVAFGAEIHIAFPAVHRLLADQVVTQDGRRYVSGNVSRHCDYAYLENPRVSQWHGRLMIKARFSGRKAIDVLGRCAGFGDQIDLTIAGTPVIQRGVLTLTEIQVDTGGKSSLYARLVSAALRGSFQKQFSIDIVGRARQLLEQKDPKAGLVREVSNVEFRQVRVGPNTIILDVEFILAVR